jgi:hypothetical protein
VSHVIMRRRPYRNLSAVARIGGLVAALAVFAAAPASAGAAPAFEVEDLAAERGISKREAERRLDKQARAPGLEESARKALGGQFGGVWVDVADGDSVKVGVVGKSEEAVETARATVDASETDAEFVDVAHSFGDLEAAAQWLASRLAEVDAGAEYPLVAGIETDRNVVSLELPRGQMISLAQYEVVEKALARFGDLIAVGRYDGKPRLRACVYAFCDPPLRGGTRLLDASQVPTCTGGFVSRGRGPNNNLYLMTAGHCFVSGTWYTRIPGNALRTLGPWNSGFHHGGGDAGIIRIVDNGYWQARSWVWVTASPDTSSNHDYRIRSDAGSVVGMRVCTTGAFYGQSDCGTVTQVGMSFLGAGNHVRGNFCGTGGDSGAPMYAGNTAYGLQTGGFTQCDSVYMAIQHAENYLNVDVTHASD